MNKKLVSLLMSGAMIGAVGTGAYATITTSIPTAQNTQSAQVQNQTATKPTTAVASKTSTPINATSKKEVNAPKIGVNYRWVKSELEAGKTVSQIKSELTANFNANISKLVSAKKITQIQATKREKTYAKHLEKANIFKGIISNGQVMKDLKAGKTLADSQNTVITNRTAHINKLLSEKKITQNQATKRIDTLKKEVSKGHGIFVNEGLVHRARKEIDAGKTVAQAKQDLIQQANAKAETLVKSGKIKSENLPKVEKRIQNRIDHSSAFKHLSNINWVQKALNDGQTATQIKSTFVSHLDKKEAKIVANKKLSTTQISKIKTHITNLQKAIGTKSIFANIMNK